MSHLDKKFELIEEIIQKGDLVLAHNVTFGEPSTIGLVQDIDENGRYLIRIQYDEPDSKTEWVDNDEWLRKVKLMIRRVGIFTTSDNRI